MAIEVLDKKYEWIEFYRKTVFPYILGYEEKQTELANDLKTVYKASTEKLGYTNLLELEEKWKHKYQR